MADTADFDEDIQSGSENEEDDEDIKPKIKILSSTGKKISLDSDDDDDEIETDDDEEPIDRTFDEEAEEDDEKYILRTLSEEEDSDKARKQKRKLIGLDEDDDDDDDDYEDDDDDENYLQKFGESLKNNVLEKHHPELMVHNHQEVEAMCRIVRDANGNIVDPLHKTMPFITKFEKARLLGERAKQINAGAQPTVKVDDEIIDGYLIALMEYEEKKIPMILRRPLPNGGCEYWKLQDLELII
jgi:DNA-directed RNA polymerase I, II, and III subunit RPABC2